MKVVPALVYAWLIDNDYDETAKSLKTAVGEKGKDLLSKAVSVGSELETIVDAFVSSIQKKKEEKKGEEARTKKKEKLVESGEVENPPPKKAKGKRARSESVSSSDSSASSSSVSSSSSEDSFVASPPPPPPTVRSSGGKKVPNEPFHRVNVEEATALIGDKRLADNTYEGTFGSSGWGSKANDILGKVKGDRFRHEKTKKKRGSYRGGTIGSEVNSYKFDD